MVLMPTDVIVGAGANVVGNTANIPFDNLYEITATHQSASTSRNINIAPAASKGKYYLVFYLKNTLNEYARLSNSPESLPFKNGYHILDSFEI